MTTNEDTIIETTQSKTLTWSIFFCIKDYLINYLTTDKSFSLVLSLIVQGLLAQKHYDILINETKL